jgi:translation initiation factor IF-3
MKKLLHLINDRIKNQKIRVVNQDELKNIVITLDEAINKANELELDLVLIKDEGLIGVCKLMNYEKFLYEETKKEKQKVLELKEIKVGPNTSEHDLGYRIKQMIGFLDRGHKVKISMQFKGREMAFVDKGELIVLTMIKGVSDHGSPEDLPKLENKRLFVTIKPKKKT